MLPGCIGIGFDVDQTIEKKSPSSRRRREFSDVAFFELFEESECPGFH